MGDLMKITTASKSNASQEKKEFVTVPEGKYLSKIAAIKKKQSDRTGSQSVQVTLEVVKGPMAGNSVFENFIFDHSNENALAVGADRAKKLGRVFGLTISSPEDLVEQSENLLDQEVIIHVKNTEREYNGEKRVYANVKKFEQGL
jgi:hypothetical protein